MNVTQGQILYLVIGGKGGTPTGGWNGGGDGSDSTLWYSGGGGGATDIRIGGISLYNRVIVAGGGGGGNLFSIWWYWRWALWGEWKRDFI